MSLKPLYPFRILLEIALVGCGPAQPAPISDLVYLRVGVDLDVEAQAVIDQLEKADWSLRQRVDERDFVALGFGRDDERAVRVVTRRGLALALPSIGTETQWRRFVVDEEGTGLDFDRDHRADIAIGELRHRGRACLTLHRVAEARLQTIPTTVEGWTPPPCIEAVRDVAGDPAPEVLAVLRFRALAVERDPRVVIPLEYRDGHFTELEPTSLASHIKTERARRDQALEGGELSPTATYEHAVELAALAALAGESTARQLAELDRGLGTTTLSPMLTEWATAARASINAEWVGSLISDDVVGGAKEAHAPEP